MWHCVSWQGSQELKKKNWIFHNAKTIKSAQCIAIIAFFSLHFRWKKFYILHLRNLDANFVIRFTYFSANILTIKQNRPLVCFLECMTVAVAHGNIKCSCRSWEVAQVIKLSPAPTNTNSLQFRVQGETNNTGGEIINTVATVSYCQAVNTLIQLYDRNTLLLIIWELFSFRCALLVHRGPYFCFFSLNPGHSVITATINPYYSINETESN